MLNPNTNGTQTDTERYKKNKTPKHATEYGN